MNKLYRGERDSTWTKRPECASPRPDLYRAAEAARRSLHKAELQRLRTNLTAIALNRTNHVSPEMTSAVQSQIEREGGHNG